MFWKFCSFILRFHDAGDLVAKTGSEVTMSFPHCFLLPQHNLAMDSIWIRKLSFFPLVLKANILLLCYCSFQY